MSPLYRTCEQCTCEPLWQQTCGYGRWDPGQHWHDPCVFWQNDHASVPLRWINWRYVLFSFD